MSDLRYESPGQRQARRQEAEAANVETARLLAEMREEQQKRTEAAKRDSRRNYIVAIATLVISALGLIASTKDLWLPLLRSLLTGS